ncbi:permease [bacterium]
MFLPTIIMGLIAVILFIIGYNNGEGHHIIGIKSAVKMTLEMMPLLLFAFITAGMLQALISEEVISSWVGAESGLRGLLVGTAAGALCPGGPYVSLPAAALFMRSGASIGTVVAFVSAWSLFSITRLPMQVGIVGWKFTLIHISSIFFFPPIAGIIANIISRRV